MKQGLSPKEGLFCAYYALGRNGREAAAKCGFRFPERTAARLLRRSDIRAQVERLDKERALANADIAAGYARLAFGCISDCVALALDGETSRSKLEEMDLFAISDLKCNKNGVEIKFFDRLRALEKLEALTNTRQSGAAAALFEAIGQGASALREEQA